MPGSMSGTPDFPKKVAQASPGGRALKAIFFRHAPRSSAIGGIDFLQDLQGREYGHENRSGHHPVPARRRTQENFRIPEGGSARRSLPPHPLGAVLATR